MNEIALVVLVVNLVLHVKGEGGCRDLLYLHCVVNKALTGHVVSTFSVLVPALEKCQHKCFVEGKCVSYNLGPVRGHVRTCELNAADHSTRPDFFVSKEGYEYCPIKNPCLSNPCLAGRLCTPDLSWDTFNCDDGGWTQWNPWNRNCNSLPSVCKPSRTRSCTSPAPQKNGAQCNGPAVETREWGPGEYHVPQINTTGCESPLGMEDGRIADIQITASFYYANLANHGPWCGRLNKKKDVLCIGGWATGENRGPGEHIQIDLGSVKVITMVATQGRYDCCDQWVTKYSLSYSNDTNTWLDYEGDFVKVFTGNYDRNTVVTNKLEVPIKARHIRLIVKETNGYSTMRMELYGCSKLGQ